MATTTVVSSSLTARCKAWIDAVKWLEEQDGETDEQTATPRPREEAPTAEADEPLLF